MCDDTFLGDLAEDQDESLLGLRVAFYKRPLMPPSPEHCFMLGLVIEERDTESMGPDGPDPSFVQKIVKVISLDGESCHYFGKTVGDVWRVFITDSLGKLTEDTASSSFFYDVLS